MSHWGDNQLLEHRTKRLDRFSYKLNAGGQYGLDIAFATDPEIDERNMAITFPFADGNRRDGVGDLLEVEGIRTERHRLNPVVLFDHGKNVVLPIGLAEDPESKKYTVSIDPSSRQAKVKAFYYQGSGLGSADRTAEHALFCEQLFDLVCKRYIRAGSIGYQAVKAMRLPSNPTTGTPEGLHLIVTNLLEVSQVVVPANQDTVVKALSMPKICGKPISPYLVKSLSPYATEIKVSLAWDGKSTVMRTDANDTPEGRQFTVSSVGSRGKPRQLSNDSESAQEAAARAEITARALHRDDNTYEVDDQAKGKGVVYGTRAEDTPQGRRYQVTHTTSDGQTTPLYATESSREASREAESHAEVSRRYFPEVEVNDQAKGKAHMRVDAYEGPYGRRQFETREVSGSGRVSNHGCVSGSHGQAVRLAERVRDNPQFQSMREGYESEIDDQAKGKVIKGIRLKYRSKAAKVRVGREGNPASADHDERSRYEVTVSRSDDSRDSDYPNQPYSFRNPENARNTAGDITRAQNERMGIPTDYEDVTGGEKRMQTYDNPLSNNDVPPAKWKPGVGAVKSIRLKYRQKAAHITRENRTINNETVSGYRVTDRGKTGEGRSSTWTGSEANANLTAQQMAVNAGQQNTEPVDETRGKDLDQNSVNPSRMKIRRRGVVTAPTPVTPSPIANEPATGVKSIRLKYRSGKNVHIERYGTGYHIENRGKTGRAVDVPGDQPLRTFAGGRNSAESAGRYLISQTNQQNTKPVDDTKD